MTIRLTAAAAMLTLAAGSYAHADDHHDRSRYLSAGVGVGSIEGLQGIVSVRPIRFFTLDARAWTLIAFSGVDVGASLQLPVGNGALFVAGNVGKGREDAIKSSEKGFWIAKYGAGVATFLPASELRFEVGRMHFGHDQGPVLCVTASWLLPLDSLWTGGDR